MTLEDLEKLKEIKYINFGNNPLSEDSREEIKAYRESHVNDDVKALS